MFISSVMYSIFGGVLCVFLYCASSMRGEQRRPTNGGVLQSLRNVGSVVLGILLVMNSVYCENVIGVIGCWSVVGVLFILWVLKGYACPHQHNTSSTPKPMSAKSANTKSGLMSKLAVG